MRLRRLLAETARRAARDEPSLPADADYRAEIVSLLERSATGAFADGAYVLGRPWPTELWGPNIWVEAAGHAARDPELLRDVWAVCRDRVVGTGPEGALRGRARDRPAAPRRLVPARLRRAARARDHRDPRGGVAAGCARGDRGRHRTAGRDRTAPLAAPGSVAGLLAPSRSRRPTRFAPTSSTTSRPEGVANLVYEADGRIVGNFFVCPIELSSVHSGLARPSGVGVPRLRRHGSGVPGSRASASRSPTRRSPGRAASGYDVMRRLAR